MPSLETKATRQRELETIWHIRESGKNAAQNYYMKLILDACRWHSWYKDNFNWNIFFDWLVISDMMKSITGMGKKPTVTSRDVPLKNLGNCTKALTVNIWISRRKWKTLLQLTGDHSGVQNRKLISAFFSFFFEVNARKNMKRNMKGEIALQIVYRYWNCGVHFIGNA